MKRFFVYIALLVCVSSCVTNRKYQLMQKNDVHVEMPKDTVLRQYSVESFDYKLQPFDVIMVRFESLTPTEFDFLNKGLSQAASINPAAMAYFGEMINNSGDIQYPVIGKVHVAGLNIFQVQEQLQALANQFLDSPKVTVRLVNFRVTFLG